MEGPKICIWGLGQEFYLVWPKFKMMESAGEIHIAAFVDQNAPLGEFDGIPVIRPQELSRQTFDYLIITTRDYFDEIYQTAVHAGISPAKIMNTQRFFWNGFPHEYRFKNRQSGREDLLLIVAGWHSSLWNVVFQRVERFVPENMDVCVVVPGTSNDYLQELCSKKQWSYLETKENKLALAQNIAVDCHPYAKFIYKIDEDIFIAEHFFSGLKQTYYDVADENTYHIGFVAPMLNVNGWGYRQFLSAMGRLQDYEEKFGDVHYAAGEIPATTDPMAAKYLWELSLPFDATAKKIWELGGDFSICYHRFSIGAILFTRDVWQRMGGFWVSRKEAILGMEESEFCKYCMDYSLAIVCANRVLAGHLSFGGKQRAFMDQYFIQNEKRFMLE